MKPVVFSIITVVAIMAIVIAFNVGLKIAALAVYAIAGAGLTGAGIYLFWRWVFNEKD